MSFLEKEDLATCPYNPSHKIAKFKLLPHVHRCKDGLKSTKKLYHCKKDSLIMFFADKKEDHIKECHYCDNIYNNSKSDKIGLDDSNFSSILKKKPNYLDDQKSISLLTGSDDSKTITLNLDEMSELNASIISTASVLLDINSNAKGKFEINNDLNYQFYKKGLIIESDKIQIKDKELNEIGKGFKQMKVNSTYYENSIFNKDEKVENHSDLKKHKLKKDTSNTDLDETKFSRKI